jgi:hypothetical protein
MLRPPFLSVWKLFLFCTSLRPALSADGRASAYIGGTQEAGVLPRAQAAKASPVPPPMYLPPIDGEAVESSNHHCDGTNSADSGDSDRCLRPRYRIGDFRDILGIYSGLCSKNRSLNANCYPPPDMSASDMNIFLNKHIDTRCKPLTKPQESRLSDYASVYAISKLLAARNMPYADYVELYISSAFSCDIAVQLSMGCTESTTDSVGLLAANHLTLALCPSVLSPLKNIMHILEGHNLVDEARVLFREVIFVTACNKQSSSSHRLPTILYLR